MKVMRIAQNFDEIDLKPTTTDKEFKRGAKLKEGISGRLEIDTSYETREAACSHPDTRYRSKY